MSLNEESHGGISADRKIEKNRAFINVSEIIDADLCNTGMDQVQY